MAKNVLSLQLLRNSTLFNDYAAAVAGITSASTNDGTIKLARFKDESGDTKTIFGIYHDMATGGTGYTIYDADHDIINGIIGRLDALDGGGSSSGTIDQKIASAISALDYTGVTTGDGVVVTNVTETDGVVSATAAEVGGLKLTNYSEGSESGHVAANDTINAALAKLQNQIDAANESKDAAIEALNYTDTAQTGYYVNEVNEANGVISVGRVALPSVNAISEAGKPITAVSESLGEISATAGTISAQYVDVADADGNLTADNVEAALAEIYSGYTAGDTAIVGGASESANTLAKLEEIVNGVAGDAKEYSIVALTREEIGVLADGANVKEAYKLVDEDGVQSGATIKIYKDQTLSGASFSGQELTLTYILADGSTTAVSVDMHDLIEQTEFASGVTWDATASKVRGVVDSTSETFLTVGADGFKLSGVQDAIDAAVNALDVTGDTAVAGQYVAAIEETDGIVAVKTRANVSEAVLNNYAKGSDGTDVAATDTINQAISKLENQIDAVQTEAAASKTLVVKDNASTHLTVSSAMDSSNSALTFTIGETDIASASALTDEIAARKAVDGQNGDTYAANTAATYISGASSLNDADIKLDAAIKNLEDSIAGKDANVSGNSTHVTVNVVEQDGAITEVNVAEDDIASAAELDTVEGAVGLTTAGTHVTTSGNYTSGASTVVGEIAALDTQVKANADNIAALSGASLSGVSVNGSALTVTNNVAALTVEGKQSEATATGNEAIVVETDANGNLTLGLANIDAGTY